MKGLFLGGFLNQESLCGPLKDAFKALEQTHSPKIHLEYVDWSHSQPQSYTDFSHFFISLLNEKKPNFVIAYSMGARLVLSSLCETSHAEYKKIHRYFLLSCHAGLETPEEKKNRAHEDQIWSQKMEHDFSSFWMEWNQREALQHTQQPPSPPLSTPKDIQKWARLLTRLSLAYQTYRFADLPQIPNLAQNVSRPQTLAFVAGINDQKFLSMHARLSDIYTKKVISNSGHRVMLDNPHELARFIVKELNS